MKVSRRDIIKLGGLATVSGIGSQYFDILPPGSANPILTNIEETKTVRSTCSPNCTGACGMDALVYKGRIVTLTQSSDYTESQHNPRGCLKGQSMLNLIYGPDRLKHPLIRTGERGEGKFRIASWDEVLDYTAEKLADIMQKYGPESVALSVQVPGTGYVSKGAAIRLATMFGWSVLHGYTMNGDLPMFYPMTFGVQTEELESIEWTNSKYIAIFGSNILVTRVPDAKFLSAAREKGAKIVVFDPNFTPTASKADEWVPINQSTDAAFGLGIVNTIISENLYDEEFIKSYTDLSFLVRMDNDKKLTANEIVGLEEKTVELKDKIPEYRDLFVVYDQDTNKFAIVDPTTLEREFNPALSGEYEVELVTGEKIKVKPVFQLLKELVSSEYTAEKVAAIVAPEESRINEYIEMIKRLGREMAQVKPLSIVYGASNYQWFHGDLKGRALSLIVALTGNIGDSGSGISTYAGQFKIRWPLGAWWSYKGHKSNWVTYLLWFNEEYRKGQEFEKYNKETPYPKNDVKAFVFGWNNPFDQHNMAGKLKEKATSGELELIVAADFQMTTSGIWADVILPSATWYEKYDLTATILHTYVQLQKPAIDPLFESMPEIWIFKELARRLVNRWNNDDLKEDIDDFYPDAELTKREESARKDGTWTLELAREITNESCRKVIDILLETGGDLVKGITQDKLEGPVKLNLPTPDNRQIPFWEQIHDKQPFPPISLPAPLAKTARFVKSGRMEFYKDEDVFLDYKESLPVHKEPFVDTEDTVSSTKYRFAFITRNALYRVHSTHSNNITMLELQDFKPKIWMNPRTAKEKGISEGTLIEAYNDRGKV